MDKQWYESKTLWFNVLALVVAVVARFGFADFEPDPQVGELAIGIIAVINLVLRLFFTDKAITLKK